MVLGRAAGAGWRPALSPRLPRIFRVHLSTAVGDLARDPELVRQDSALYRAVRAERGGVVVHGDALQCHDRIGPQARPVARSLACARHRDLRVRHVRSRSAESRSAGHDALWLLVPAASAALVGGLRVRARHRHQGVSGRRAALSGLAQAVGRGGQHARLCRHPSLCGAGADPRLRAQRRRAQHLVSGHGGVELGEGLRPARRAELVMGQPVHHRDDAPPGQADQLQSGGPQ